MAPSCLPGSCRIALHERSAYLVDGSRKVLI